MRRFDVCNGDADGLCAVLQWRLAHPQPATLVTGLKRELELLQQVPAEAGDEVLVCDLSMQRNHAALLRLLRRAACRCATSTTTRSTTCRSMPALQACIDFDPRVCTSLLMDRLLDGRFRAWALVGAYGDNLTRVADALAVGMGLDEAERQQLRLLGEGINYNAYGDEAGDQHIAPQQLYARLSRHAHPLELLRQDSIGSELDALRRADLQQALAQDIHAAGRGARWVRLPDAPWSRRVIGGLANELAVERAAAGPRRAQGRPAAAATSSACARRRARPRGPTSSAAASAAAGVRAPRASTTCRPPSCERFVAELSAARWGG